MVRVSVYDRPVRHVRGRANLASVVEALPLSRLQLALFSRRVQNGAIWAARPIATHLTFAGATRECHVVLTSRGGATDSPGGGWSDCRPRAFLCNDRSSQLDFVSHPASASSVLRWRQHVSSSNPAHSGTCHVGQRRFLSRPMFLDNRAVMFHRHLNHQTYTLAAIDDVIDRGELVEWAQLRRALRTEPEVRARIIRICESHIADPYAQRYHFWSNYVKERTA